MAQLVHIPDRNARPASKGMTAGLEYICGALKVAGRLRTMKGVFEALNKDPEDIPPSKLISISISSLRLAARYISGGRGERSSGVGLKRHEIFGQMSDTKMALSACQKR